MILMAVVVIYGVYTFLHTTPIKPGVSGTVKQNGDLNKFVIDVANKIADKSQPENDQYAVRRASAEWTANPFLSIPAADVRFDQQEAQAEFIENAVEFYFTGYLNIGGSELAIINGKEYRKGDRMEEGGYIVKRIEPKLVEIAYTDGGEPIRLPLESPGTRTTEPQHREEKTDDQREAP